MNFEGKIMLITGASSGIGYGCAKRLLESGARVAGFDINPGKSTSENYNHYRVDVSNEDVVKRSVDGVTRDFGIPDGLINGAGIFSNEKPFYEMSLEEWNKVISTNLTGTFICSKYVAEKMTKCKRGKIVNISCIRSRIFRPNMADYAASKGGVVSLTSAMALDLARFNIQVNAVAPGFTFTGMTEKSFNRPEIKAAAEKIIPLGRIASPDDIADVVLFLLSDMSRYVTGETIFADGGFKILK